MTNQLPLINFKPKLVLGVLLVLIVILFGLSIWGQDMRFNGITFDIRGIWHEFWIDLLMHGFNMDAEGNVPTFYNILLLILCALLLGTISLWKYSIKDKFRFDWIVLSLLFFLLATDEAASMHERLIKPVRTLVEAGVFFRFTWVIPGMIAVVLFGLVYLRFFLHLDKKYKILFFISLCVYVGGVIGGEITSGYFSETIGMRNFTYALFAGIEESIEMIGCSLFIYSLLEYIKQYLPEGIILKIL